VVLVKRNCKYCDNTFSIDEKDIRAEKKRGNNRGVFCSIVCLGAWKSKLGKLQVSCSQCSVLFLKLVSQMKSKTGLSFCSSSCSATYNNNHKKMGYRRSKLEIYIEEKIKNEFPNLNFRTNAKDIGYELDFYFPDKAFAIEINGIYHYKPIHGEEKLLRIKHNDQLKILLCEKMNIKLIIFKDESGNFSQKIALNNWIKIKEIISNY
jgi:hypothetical protein